MYNKSSTKDIIILRSNRPALICLSSDTEVMQTCYSVWLCQSELAHQKALCHLFWYVISMSGKSALSSLYSQVLISGDNVKLRTNSFYPSQKAINIISMGLKGAVWQSRQLVTHCNRIHELLAIAKSCISHPQTYRHWMQFLIDLTRKFTPQVSSIFILTSLKVMTVV